MEQTVQNEKTGKLLEVKDLRVSFFTPAGEVKAVSGISYDLDYDEVMGIVGESGSGKSQEAYSIMGLLQSPGKVIGGSITFGLLYWVTMSRLIRGQILQLKQQEYVTAARALGASGGRIIKRHLLPNCIGQIVTTTFLQIPSAIFTESFLSFLGMGVSAPMTSLGSMCSDALGGLNTYPYRLFIPAAILSLMILCLNLFGDGLRDALDPRLKK